jgi:hypothetical protein
MKRWMATSLVGAAMILGWAAPARADVPSEFGCGSNKSAGSDCETSDGKNGTCVTVEFDSGAPPGLLCDTSKDTGGGCTVGQIGAGGGAEAAALGLLFAACVAMRRRRI